MSKRDHISLTTKLAAVLLEMKRPDESGNLVPWIDREAAKEMTPEMIISLFHFDHHPIPKAFGGTDHPTNLTPRPIMEHRIKTAKIDVPQIAKTARISAAHQAFQRKLLARQTGEEAEEAPRRKPIFPGSRQSKYKKKINGRVERRGS
jgi:hypothetical protein